MNCFLLNMHNWNFMLTCFILIGMLPLFKVQCNYFSFYPFTVARRVHQKLKIASINLIRLIFLLVPEMNLQTPIFWRPLFIATEVPMDLNFSVYYPCNLGWFSLEPQREKSQTSKALHYFILLILHWTPLEINTIMATNEHKVCACFLMHFGFHIPSLQMYSLPCFRPFHNVQSWAKNMTVFIPAKAADFSDFFEDVLTSECSRWSVRSTATFINSGRNDSWLLL